MQDPKEPVKKETVRKPGRDDVHEQREPDQAAEGVVDKPGARPEAEPDASTKRE
jgi:hypothetical protein